MFNFLKQIHWKATRHTHKWEMEAGILPPPSDYLPSDWWTRSLFGYGVFCRGCNYVVCWGESKEKAVETLRTFEKSILYEPPQP